MKSVVLHSEAKIKRRKNRVEVDSKTRSVCDKSSNQERVLKLAAGVGEEIFFRIDISAIAIGWWRHILCLLGVMVALGFDFTLRKHFCYRIESYVIEVPGSFFFVQKIDLTIICSSGFTLI